MITTEDLDQIDAGIARLVLERGCLALSEKGKGYCYCSAKAYFVKTDVRNYVYIYCELHAQQHKYWPIMEELTTQDLFYLKCK